MEDSTQKPSADSESQLYLSLIERINDMPRLLPEGASALPWIIGNDIVEIWKAKVREVLSTGVELSRLDCLACNYALLEEAKSIVIIESKCFDHETEWSRPWKEWLMEIGRRDDITIRDYYVLLPASITSKDANSLLATEKFLRAAKFTLSMCDKAYLQDSLGKRLSHFDSLNIFGRLAIHNDIICKDESEIQESFAGGEGLLIWLHDIEKEPVYAEIKRLIQKHSKPVTSECLKEFQKTSSM